MTDLEKIEEAILRLHRGMQRAFERSLLPGEVSTHVAGPTGFMVIGGQQVPYEIRDGKVVWLTDTGSAPQD